MTVADLIEKLRQLPQDLEVYGEYDGQIGRFMGPEVVQAGQDPYFTGGPAEGVFVLLT